MSTYSRAEVTAVEHAFHLVQEAVIRFSNDAMARALAFEELTGPVEPGDEVIVNTTAVELALGSGGYHFVLWNLDRTDLDTGSPGHIMKLRYTPLQINMEAAEERLGISEPAALRRVLEGMPVIAGELHSQLLPAVLSYLKAAPDGRMVYVMSDGGALPLRMSRTVRFLEENGSLAGTITCGHAFGGDLEAVNIYGALVAARLLLGATAAVVLMGPGTVGTASSLGFSGMEQAQALNCADALGGAPVAIPRISFADTRSRHSGLSHHTVTVLCVGTTARCFVPVPAMEPDRSTAVLGAMEQTGITSVHDVREMDASGVCGIIDECGYLPTFMGRGHREEPEFFMAAGAAGLLAAELGGNLGL